jgi:hypothetical protein
LIFREFITELHKNVFNLRTQKLSSVQKHATCGAQKETRPTKEIEDVLMMCIGVQFSSMTTIGRIIY